MALSYYSHWAAASQPLHLSDSFPQPPELHQFATAALTVVDPLFDANHYFFYSENSGSVKQYDCLSGTGIDGYNSLTADNFFLHQNLEPFHYPKRHKGCDYDDIYPEFMPGYFNGIVPNPPIFPNYEIECAVPSLPDFPTGPTVYSYGSCQSTMKKELMLSSSGNLSAQSIAARQRRRKITEKTQELEKLVPGGQKMNTAEMLQAAYKYIKCLQAQVGILEFMSPYNQFESEEELHDLLESPLIQEKLNSTEKCLVPQKFVQELSNDHQIVQSNPALLELLVKQEQSGSM